MNEKKVSIIMPVYNAERTVEKSIHSVLDQTYTNYELIVIDDGSTDKTNMICQKFTQNDKITYILKGNEGVSKARNIGIEKATGDYICFIDSDDQYEKEYLQTMIDEIIKTKSDLVVCGYKAITDKQKDINYKEKFTTNKVGEVIEKLQPIVLFNQVWNKIFYTRKIKENQIYFDEKMSIAEDYQFVLDYLECCHQISYLNQALYRYTISNTGLGFKYRNDKNEIKLLLIDNIKEKYLAAGDDMEYVYKSYIKQLYAGISNLVDKRLNVTFKERKKIIKEFLNSKNNIKRKEEIQKVKDIKYKILAKMMIDNHTSLIMLLGKLANIYDKHNKKKLLNKGAK